MSWLRALKETGRSGLTVERKRLEPLVAVRGAAGLALVVALSLWAFGPVVAAGSAFGAFQAAIATFQRSWRPRPELAFASGASLGISTFLGYLTGAQSALFLALLVVWTFLAGMSWAAGPTIGLIATSNVAMMLITVTLPTSVAEAAGHAAIMVVGGLVQAALVVVFPVRRWGAHRDALADALAAEADYARRLRHDPAAPFDPEPLMQARRAAALTPHQARTRPAELHGSRGHAERIRPVLASLADPAVGAAAEGQERDRVRELLAAAGAILDAAARAIRRGEPVALPPNAVAAFKTPDTGAILRGPALRAASRLGLLLYDVVETAGSTDGPSGLPVPARGGSAGAGTAPGPDDGPDPGTGHGAGDGMGHGAGDGTDHGAGATEAAAPGAASAGASGSAPAGAEPAKDMPPVGRPLRRPGFFGLVPVALRAMRQEARLRSPVLRHAIRVSAVAAAGYLLGTVLPLGHGYWAPMAAVMVMRPDFSQTYSRAVARLGGTLVGVTLATAVVRLTDPGTYVTSALAVACAGLMYLLMRTGQVAAQACIAAYVVFLLGMGGEQWTQTVPERVVLTLVGGLLAMLSYALYPAWETPRLRNRLADWLSTNGRYAAAVVGHYADPADRGRTDVREALLTARDARTAWREASTLAKTEPVRHRGLSRSAADDAEAALVQLGRVAMLIEAHLPDHGARPQPAAARLAEALRKATDQGAKAVRERRVPRWDAVRDALAAWDEEDRAGETPSDPPPRPAGQDAGAAPDDKAVSTAPAAPAAREVRADTDQVLRSGADLLLACLDELSDALDTPAHPMAVDGTDAAHHGGDDGPGRPGSTRVGGAADGSDQTPETPQERQTTQAPETQQTPHAPRTSRTPQSPQSPQSRESRGTSEGSSSGGPGTQIP